MNNYITTSGKQTLLYDTHLEKIQWQKSCKWQRRWGNLSLTSDRSSQRRAQPEQNPWNAEMRQRLSETETSHHQKERICIEQWWINWLWNMRTNNFKTTGGFSLHNATKANTVEASSSFDSMRRVRLLPLNGILVYLSSPLHLMRFATVWKNSLRIHWYRSIRGRSRIFLRRVCTTKEWSYWLVK